MMTKTLEERVAEAVPVYRRELVYVDYRDELTPADVEEMIHGEWPESFDDWIGEAQWRSAHELADELIAEEEFTEDERDALVETLVDMDTSEPWRDLARNTGRMLFRYSPSEDDMVWIGGDIDTAERLHAELGLAPEFLPAVQAIWPEIEGYTLSGGGFGATFVFSADVAEMIEWGTHVTVSDPFLWLTNPWSGNGYGEVAEGCTIKLAKADVHVDRYAWGYGADTVFGGLPLPDSDIEISTEED